jgi:hypothetical protein
VTLFGCRPGGELGQLRSELLSVNGLEHRLRVFDEKTTLVHAGEVADQGAHELNRVDESCIRFLPGCFVVAFAY